MTTPRPASCSTLNRSTRRSRERPGWRRPTSVWHLRTSNKQSRAQVRATPFPFPSPPCLPPPLPSLSPPPPSDRPPPSPLPLPSPPSPSLLLSPPPSSSLPPLLIERRAFNRRYRRGAGAVPLRTVHHRSLPHDHRESEMKKLLFAATCVVWHLVFPPMPMSASATSYRSSAIPLQASGYCFQFHAPSTISAMVNVVSSIKMRSICPTLFATTLPNLPLPSP